MLLRTRILIALSIMALLVVTTCMFCIFLLKDSAERFSDVVEIDIEAAREVEDLRHIMATAAEVKPDQGDLELIADGIEDLRVVLNARPEEPKAAILANQMASEFWSTNKDGPSGGVTASMAITPSLQKLAATLAAELSSAAVGRSRDQEKQVGRAIQVMAALTICAAVIIGFIYVDMSREVLRPIARLKESIRRLKEDDFSGRIEVRSSDEIGKVSAAFNEMAEQLRERKIATDLEVLRLNQESRDILLGFPYPLFILSSEGKLSQTNDAGEPLLTASGSKLPPKLRTLVNRSVEKNVPYLPQDLDKAMLFRLDERETWFLPRVFRFERLDPEGNSKRDLEKDTEREGEVEPGWVLLLIDVTRVRWLEGMRTDLLGTVSHEIKTPLTSIRMVLHLLAEQKTGELNLNQEKMVTTAVDECERLLETLENLLQINRIESGSDDIELESVPPAVLIEVAETNFQAMRGELDLELLSSRDDDLPAVLADSQRIGMVMRNFISNAIKHSPPGSVIGVRCGPEKKGFVRFSVFDQGPGVDAEDSEKVFQRFYRGQAKARKIEGVGLGLSISREIVTAHSGRIGVTRLRYNDPGLPEVMRSSQVEPTGVSTPDSISEAVPGVTEFYFELPVANA